MRLCKTEQLKEKDIIAKTVMTNDYQVLLSEGVVLKKEYIQKLMELGIEEVYIQSGMKPDKEVIAVFTEDTGKILKEKVKTILEKHLYKKNNALMELRDTADKIISNILEEEEAIEQVFEIKERSADIYEHSINVCTLSIIVGIKLKLKMQQIHDIGIGSLLHDIGLRYLTVKYDNKNINELNVGDKAEYKKHPVYGYTALQEEKWISEKSKNIILFHHERLNGSGYPLKITSLPIECSVVAICDAFDEMICGIGYARMKVYEAIEYLKFAKGVLFDERVIETFFKIVAVYPIDSVVITNDRRTAKVVKQNNQFPDRPVLRIIKDSKGNTVEEEEVVDLVKANNIFIDKVIN